METIVKKTIHKPALVVAGAVLAVALVVGGAFGIGTALAANITTIPDSTAKISTDTRLAMNLDNVTIKANASEFQTKEYSNGQTWLYLKAKTAGTRWSYENPVEFTFSNACTINGRQVDAKMNIDKITCIRKADQGAGMLFSFMSIDSWGIWFTNDLGPDWKQGQATTYCGIDIDYTVTFSYHDDGSTVDLPFFQRIQDIDVNWWVTEQWTAVSGFDKFFEYQSCEVKNNGNTFSAVGRGLNDDDSILVGGVLASTSSGKFSGQFQEGGCGTALEIFSQYTVLDDPTKQQRTNSPWKYE